MYIPLCIQNGKINQSQLKKEIMKTSIATFTAKTQTGLKFEVTAFAFENKDGFEAVMAVGTQELNCTLAHTYANGSVASVKTDEFFKALGTKKPSACKMDTMGIKLTTSAEKFLADAKTQFSTSQDPYFLCSKKIESLRNEKTIFVYGVVGSYQFSDSVNSTVKSISKSVTFSVDMLRDMDDFQSKTPQTYLGENGVEDLKAAGYTVYHVDNRNWSLSKI